MTRRYLCDLQPPQPHATLIDEALKKGYWKARAEPDGRLLIQFADLTAAEIWGKPRAS